MSDCAELVSLAELCDVFADGNWVQSKDQSPSGIRLVQTGNIGTGTFKNRLSKARFISEETFRNMKCAEVFAGDCLVSRLPDPVGRACIIPDLGERMITAVDCSILRLDRGRILPEYFCYYAQSASYFNEVERYCTGATRKRISRKNLGKVGVPVAALSQQRRIVAILDEAFADIETAIVNTEKNLANARALSESYLNGLFEAGSQEWSISRLSDIADVRGGKRLPKGQKLQLDPTPYPYISVSDFDEFGSVNSETVKYISQEVRDQISRYTISSRDVYISIAGTIGKSGIVPPELDGANLTENACKLVLTDGIDPKFVFLFTRTGSFKEQTLKNTRTTAQPKLALSRLQTIQIPLPGWETQQRVVRQVERVEGETRRLGQVYGRKLANLSEIKESLLQKAFSGELTADRAEREVESATV